LRRHGTRRTDVNGLGPNALFGHQVRQGCENQRFAGGFLRALCAEGFERILLQAQAPGLVDLELGQFEGAGPKIDRQK